ncbi:S26 family signal peptidase [Kribbella sp. NPDC051770]|uniref:S26 family signal peptidase n=1 Tax=Kribbella sp. NPDC051770 TaxID=3155413 RepID=UPI0034227A41
MIAATAVLVLLLAAALVWVRRTWLRVTVVGPSMLPTYRPDDQVLTRKVRAGRIRAGEVVVFEGPAADEEHAATLLDQFVRDYAVVERRPLAAAPPERVRRRMIKRVAAVPGERLPFDVPGHPAGSIVPAGHLAVAGDNAAASVDSRQYGFISFDQVVGRAKVS